jgi:transcriptional regulator with XRE-family HTH domain
MKLGDVVRKERERHKLATEQTAIRLGIPLEQYLQIEAGESLGEEWGPKLALIAIKLQTPTSRLIAETGKSSDAKQLAGQCGKLIKLHRERKGLSQKELADHLQIDLPEVEDIESGKSPLETFAPLLLAFAEQIDQPIFNLFYPCGLPFAELNDYP